MRSETFLKGKLIELQKEYNAVFEDLGMINEDGFQVAYAGPFALANALYSQSDWFKKAIESEFYNYT